MGPLIQLYFRQGSASDLIVLGRAPEQEFSPGRREKLKRILSKEGMGSAAERFTELPFALHKGTNHFNDEFYYPEHKLGYTLSTKY